MTPEDISVVFKKHWRKGFGSIAATELEFLQDLIRERRPKSFVEIGTASGLSAGLIATIMEENGGERFVTIDHDDTFFGDPSKPNGFLINEVYQGDGIDVTKLPFKTALDVPVLGQEFDMAFVDANHQHPWTTIDTLCLVPFLRGADPIIVHHDLLLYRKQDVPFGIGPKILFDQFPSDQRMVEPIDDPNIFALTLGSDRLAIEKALIASFLMPWTLRTPIQPHFLAAIRSTIENHYSPRLLAAFDLGVKRYNKSFVGVPLKDEEASERSLLHRAVGRFRRAMANG
ncbi:MAG: class I SAM-dependent methyltransferase [Pseudomonadota bacterium]